MLQRPKGFKLMRWAISYFLEFWTVFNGVDFDGRELLWIIDTCFLQKYKFFNSYWLTESSPWFFKIALQELAERVNGDMRMALNQLQYMSLSMSVINYDDIKQRFLTSSKDEDISPFTAVDKYDV